MHENVAAGVGRSDGRDVGVVSPSIETMLAGASPADFVRSEIGHRFRNLIAVTQSLVNQTLQDGVSVAQARDTLNQRLAAMGAAIDLLLRTDWQSGSLRTIVREALAGHASFLERIACDGPEVEIGGNAVLALTLALHELATNAIKYGALSISAGSVELRWKCVPSTTGPQLWLQWVEHDGPPVQPPTRRGFGSQLISSGTGQVLGGEVELDFAPSGVTWLLIAPLAGLAS